MPWLPGTTGTSSRSAVLMAFDLLPIVSMLATGGPMKLMPWLRHNSAKLRVLRQEADARMQRVDAFVFGDAQHAHRVQIAFIRRIAADADDAIVFGEHVDRRRIHVRVGLHQHHLDAVALRDRG